VGVFVLWGLCEMIQKNKSSKYDQTIEKQKPNRNTQSKLRQIPIDELKQILINHKKWLKSKGKEGKKADLRLINLKEITIKRAILAFADMQQSNLFRVNIQNANLIRINLKKSYLCQVNLRMANLSKANLESAKIIGGILTDSNLTGTNLKYCNCKGTDFEGAILFKANLQGADLLSAFFDEAVLRGANLKGAKNLTIEQLQGAKTLYHAELDSELLKKVKKNCPYLLKESI